MTLAYNITAVFCSFGAWIFFVIGCIGNDASTDNIKNAPWYTNDYNHHKAWLGLSNIAIENPPAQGGNMNFDYNDSQCALALGQDICNRCKDNGRIAYGLLVVAAILAFVSMITGIVQCANDKIAGLNYATVSLNGVSSLFAVVGYSCFTVRCANKVDKINGVHLESGAGAALVVLGFLLAAVAVAVQSIDIVRGPASAASAKSSAHQPVTQSEVEEAKPVESA